MKNAIVFGASSGIGKHLANYLIGDGYKVVITGRRKDLLKQIKEENPEAYEMKSFDVQDISETTLVFNTIVKELKDIHLIITNSRDEKVKSFIRR